MFQCHSFSCYVKCQQFMQKKETFASQIPFLAHWQRKSDGKFKKKQEPAKHIDETSSDLLKVL